MYDTITEMVIDPEIFDIHEIIQFIDEVPERISELVEYAIGVIVDSAKQGDTNIILGLGRVIF